MNHKDFFEKLTSALSAVLPETLPDDEAQATLNTLIEHLKQVPRCNKCGKAYEASKWKTTEVTVHWGYNSTGKDTDCDKWGLCQDCTQNFNAAYQPICSLCKKSVLEVMADLAHRNPHHVDYGDFQSALKRYLDDNHCGFEYAKVNDRVICEVCYEAFTDSFVLPIPGAEYMIFSGDYLPTEGNQRKSRLSDGMGYKIEECANSYYAEDWLSWEDAVEVRTASDNQARILQGRYTENKPEFREYMVSRGHKINDEVVLTTGAREYLRIPVSWFKSQAEIRGTTFNPKAIKIINKGYAVQFENLIFKSSDLIEEWLGKAEDDEAEDDE